MTFIFVSTRNYRADFRKFLIEALRANGHEVWHVRIGRCSEVTNARESGEHYGIPGLIATLRRLRIVSARGKVVYVDSTGAATPVRSLLFRMALRRGTWCFDIFDNLHYGYRGSRLLKARISIALLAKCSRILLVLSKESLRLFPGAWHLDNAADISWIDRRDRNFTDLVVLSAIDQRFDFEFVRQVARLCSTRRIIIHGYVLHEDESIGRRLAELCAEQRNVIYAGKYAFDDIRAIIAPYAIGLAPYVAGSGTTEFINPDKYYMFLKGGLEVISTDIPQARRMHRWIHVAHSPEDVIELAKHVENDRSFRKNAGAVPDFSWRRRAQDLVEIVSAVEAGKRRQRNASRAPQSRQPDENPQGPWEDRNYVSDLPIEQLRLKTVRGTAAKLCGQAGNFVLRLVFVAALARLLSPQDFGLVAMVTVVTGVYELFTSAGLSSATIQRSAVTHQQISTLFWINVLVGVALAAVCILTAPILVEFYHEPRLFWITIAIAAGFVLNGAGVQHSAILQRKLRYVVVTAIELSAQIVSVAVGIGMALAGFGYWALVGAAIASPAVSTVSMWTATGWIPGAPKRTAGIGSMLRFGGTVTLNTVIVYIAYNFEKLLLGRVWGAQALGIYGRAFQLINLPTGNINAAVGGIAFSALSRLQSDPPRLRSYFLKGYSLVISMTVPIAMFSAVFAEDIILGVLGPNWSEAIDVFRLLAPSFLILGIISPLAWLLLAVGLQGRSLRVGLVLSPIVMTSYVIGLPYGPAGVAFAYSVAMMLWLVPHVLWCLHGTVVSPKDLFVATSRPLLGGLAATAFTWTAMHWIGDLSSPAIRLLFAAGIMLPAYGAILLFIMGQYKFYVDLLQMLLRSSSELRRLEPRPVVAVND